MKMVEVKTLTPAVIVRTVVACGEDVDLATSAALKMGGPFQVTQEEVKETGPTMPVSVKEIGEVKEVSLSDDRGPHSDPAVSGGAGSPGPEAA